jgi:hypothetical protein
MFLFFLLGWEEEKEENNQSGDARRTPNRARPQEPDTAIWTRYSGGLGR